MRYLPWFSATAEVKVPAKPRLDLKALAFDPLPFDPDMALDVGW